MGNVMDMPDTFEEFIKEYSFKDEKEYYTNGSELVQVLRVMQAWEYYKNKVYEEGCVAGYRNCIKDHTYNREQRREKTNDVGVTKKMPDNFRETIMQRFMKRT